MRCPTLKTMAEARPLTLPQQESGCLICLLISAALRDAHDGVRLALPSRFPPLTRLSSPDAHSRPLSSTVSSHWLAAVERIYSSPCPY